jgi:hypothetical protein
MYVYAYFLFNLPIINPNSFYINLLHRAAQACYLIVIIYGLYPAVFTAQKFSKNNYEYIANEFEFIKKSLFVGLPILVIVVIVSQLLSHFQISLPFSLYDAVFAILAASVATVTGCLLRIVTYTARREFRFYIARGFCRISSEKQNNFDKIKYLFLSLDSYNKYLVRKTKFGIKNIDRIYSEIIHTDARKNDEMIKSVNEHLCGGGLDLATYLSKIYKVADTEQFFIKEGLVQKLKVVAAFLAAAIPIVASIIQLYFKSA